MGLIVISGYKGSGKDTAADYLIDSHGYTRLSFADTLKEMVSEQYEVPLNYFHDQKLKEVALEQYPVVSTDGFTDNIHDMLAAEFDSDCWTPRALCILEGSIKRSVKSSYWVQVVLNAIEALGANANVVIPDLRYRSEIDQILEAFPEAKITRVDRGLELDTNDPSERDLDDYPFSNVLDNTKDIKHLQEQLKNLI